MTHELGASSTGRAAAGLSLVSGAAEPARLAGPVDLSLLRDEILAEVFAATVRERPEAVCLRAGRLSLTYAEVDRAATAIACSLVRAGLKPGGVAGLWMERGADLLVAQLAVAKTGAAWLPFDAEAPAERIATCLGDAEALLLIADNATAAKAAGHMPCPVRLAPDLGREGEGGPAPDPRAAGADPDSPAYLIYTSGSTGVPKGIVITNRNICHYLRSANALYRIEADDVVFQGASVAFDLSMEEIWIPYLVGASLFVADAAMLGEADKLPAVLAEAGVTVLDTVPTLLGMVAEDIPSLRLIILGGEACPPTVAQRWCRPGRRIYNSYGPTEATVVATADEVRVGEPVTIGGPITNYTCYVASESLDLLPRGQEGELLIGGPGVARGYLKRDALTAEKFIANPFGGKGHDPVLYRSGDAVVMDAAGRINFRGRIDDQVKIRGFRVELGEIEAKVSHQPGVSQAAVVLRTDAGLDQLVAFIVPERGAEAALTDAKTLRPALRLELPPYMVPARYEIVADLPRLPSGKTDRKALKAAVLTTPVATEAQEEPQTPTEGTLLAAAQAVLPPQSVPFDADFFTDLGGHSLLAARFVSVVRQTPRLAGVTLQDMYKLRTLRALAAELDSRAAAAGDTVARNLGFVPPSLRRRALCGVAQAVTLPFILALSTVQWLGVFLSYMLLSGGDADFVDEVLWLVGVYLVINVGLVAVAILGKWLIIGRMKPGRYPMWGTYFFRWWLVQRLVSLTHPKSFQGSPLMRVFLRALGARVGEGALVSEIEVGSFDLLTIGAHASLGGRLNIANVRFEGDTMIVGATTIGDNAAIGTSCVLEDDVVVGEGAELRDLTSVPSGARVGAWEIWDGSPGRRVGFARPEELEALPVASASRRGAQSLFYTVMILLVPPLGLLPIFPAFWVFEQVDNWLDVPQIDRFTYLASLPVLAWPTAFVLVILTVAFITALRWVVLPKVEEGRYSVHSWFYVRKWVMNLASEVTLDTLSSLYATVYMRSWYRLMGAKIGKDTEISTNFSGRFDLIEIGEKCFIADEVLLGDEEVRRGWMTLRKVRTGSRVFIGNDGIVPIGADIPDDTLVGIKSKPPGNEAMSAGDTWFGTPPIKLPVRQRFEAAGGSAWTYEPPLSKKILRPLFEAVRVSLPTMLFIVFGTWAVEFIGPRLLDGRLFQAGIYFILVSVLMPVVMTAIVIAIKWASMGVYKPTAQPMWSWWAMRTEAVGVICFALGGKVLLDHLRGTPFLPWAMRLYGVKVGRGVYMDMTDITEFDCVTIGDYAVLNALSALQTHLYEDRVMKVGRISIGRGVTIGAGTTVLYDTQVDEFARLGPLTLVMKGEGIPAHSEWAGAPAEPRRVPVLAAPVTRQAA